MASIQLGPLVTSIRGKFGGGIFQGGRTGFQLRILKTPPKNKSTLQSGARQRYSTLCFTWRTLAQVDRDAWNTAASITTWYNADGDPYNPSGFNLYMATNLSLTATGSTALTTPQAPALLPALGITSVTSNSGANTITLVFTNTPLPANTLLVCQASPPGSLGRTYKSARMAIIRTFSSGTTSPQALTSFYSSRFGEWRQIGNVIQFQFWLVNRSTGQVGLPVSIISTIS